jgi:hypothetical protein
VLRTGSVFTEMMNRCHYLLAGVVACVAIGAVAGGAPTPPAATPPKPAISSPRFLERTNGPVRGVLLRAGFDGPPGSGGAFGVTYGIEVPQPGAFSDLHIRSDQEASLTVQGKPVPFHGGTVSCSGGFNELRHKAELAMPRVGPGKAMLFEQVDWLGLKLDAVKVDVRIQFSWRKTPLRFDFANVEVKRPGSPAAVKSQAARPAQAQATKRETPSSVRSGR